MKKTILLFAGLSFITFKNQAQTVTDIDGNVYNTITIGTKIWMKENLKVSRYQNGNAIPHIVATNLWNLSATHAMCYYDNDSIANKAVYGALYNWYVVNDSRNVCPSGWHVPSDADWSTTEQALGSDTISIGGKMKEINTTHWIAPNTGATNTSNFTALPGGTRSYVGMYNNLTNYGYFWSSTTGLNNSMIARYLVYNDANIHTDEFNPSAGFSIRCISTLTTQINNNSFDKQMQIYPNPATDRVYIDCAERRNIIMNVYNIIGDCVFKSDLTSGTNEIDISALKSGIYIIQLTGADGTIQRKLVKN